jgi:hypothetical protein
LVSPPEFDAQFSERTKVVGIELKGFLQGLEGLVRVAQFQPNSGHVEMGLREFRVELTGALEAKPRLVVSA